jgi:hypothetical protein
MAPSSRAATEPSQGSASALLAGIRTMRDVRDARHHRVMHVEAQVTASRPGSISNDRQPGSVSSCMGRGPIAQDALRLRLCGSARRSLWLRRAEGSRSKNPWSVPSGAGAAGRYSRALAAESATLGRLSRSGPSGRCSLARVPSSAGRQQVTAAHVRHAWGSYGCRS